MSSDDDLPDDWASAMQEQEKSDGSVEDEWAAAMAEAEEVQKVGSPQDKVTAAPLESFDEAELPTVNTPPDMDVILDIPVTISMEVGNTQIAIRNLLQLNQGSVIELDRLAGEPLDVLVNGTLIAHGEVVMVNEKFGIRLTDVISPSERIKKLR
jgi:flagellar motor switch protein FliN